MAYQKLPGIYRKEDPSPAKQKKSIGDGVPVEEKKKELSTAEENKRVRKLNKQIDIERHSEKALGKKPEYYRAKGIEREDFKKWEAPKIPDLPKLERLRTKRYLNKKNK